MEEDCRCMIFTLRRLTKPEDISPICHFTLFGLQEFTPLEHSIDIIAGLNVIKTYEKSGIQTTSHELVDGWPIDLEQKGKLSSYS